MCDSDGYRHVRYTRHNLVPVRLWNSGSFQLPFTHPWERWNFFVSTSLSTGTLVFDREKLEVCLWAEFPKVYYKVIFLFHLWSTYSFEFKNKIITKQSSKEEFPSRVLSKYRLFDCCKYKTALLWKLCVMCLLLTSDLPHRGERLPVVQLLLCQDKPPRISFWYSNFVWILTWTFQEGVLAKLKLLFPSKTEISP